MDNRKTKFLIFHNNPIEIDLEENITNFTIEDLLIMKNDFTLYDPKFPIYIRSKNSFNHSWYSFKGDEEQKSADRYLGIYHKMCNYFGWNKHEGNFLSFSANSTFEARGRYVTLELLDKDENIINLSTEYNLIFVIISYF